MEKEFNIKTFVLISVAIIVSFVVVTAGAVIAPMSATNVAVIFPVEMQKEKTWKLIEEVGAMPVATGRWENIVVLTSETEGLVKRLYDKRIWIVLNPKALQGCGLIPKTDIK